MRRPGPELARALERAEAEAIRRGHTHVRVEHVLRALLQPRSPTEGLDPEATWSAFARAAAHGLSARKLVLAADEELARFPAVATYRDSNVSVPRDPQLRRMLEHVARGPSLLYGPVGGGEFLEEFLASSRGADFWERCELDRVRIDELAERAAAISARWGESAVNAEHVLIALCGEPEFADAVRRIGSDFGDLQEAVRSRLVRERRSRVFVGDVEFNAAAIVANMSDDAERVGVVLVARAVLSNPKVAPILREVRVDGYDLFFAMVHPNGLDETETGPLGIRVFDDSYSTQEFVVELFTSIWELESAAAMRLMIEVHERGQAIVAQPDRQSALRHIAIARASARKQWMPLRMVLIAPSSESVG